MILLIGIHFAAVRLTLFCSLFSIFFSVHLEGVCFWGKLFHIHHICWFFFVIGLSVTIGIDWFCWLWIIIAVGGSIFWFHWYCFVWFFHCVLFNVRGFLLVVSIISSIFILLMIFICLLPLSLDGFVNSIMFYDIYVFSVLLMEVFFFSQLFRLCQYFWYLYFSISVEFGFI